MMVVSREVEDVGMEMRVGGYSSLVTFEERMNK